MKQSISKINDEQLKQYIAAGMGIRQIAAQHKMNPGTVSRRVRALRSDKEVEAEITKAVKSGPTMEELLKVHEDILKNGKSDRDKLEALDKFYKLMGAYAPERLKIEVQEAFIAHIEIVLKEVLLPEYPDIFNKIIERLGS